MITFINPGKMQYGPMVCFAKTWIEFDGRKLDDESTVEQNLIGENDTVVVVKTDIQFC